MWTSHTLINEPAMFVPCVSGGSMEGRKSTDAQYWHTCEVQFPRSEESRLCSLLRKAEHGQNRFTSVVLEQKENLDGTFQAQSIQPLSKSGTLDLGFLNLSRTNDGAESTEQSSTIPIPDVELATLRAQWVQFTSPTAKMNYPRPWYLLYIILIV